MTRFYKTLICSFALAGILTLTACGSGGGDAASPSAAPSAPGSSPSASAAAASALPSAFAPAETTAVSPSPAASAAAAAPSAGAPTASAAAKQLQELMKLAKEGKAPGIKYAAHVSLIDEVYKDWGKADKEDSVGSSGIYSTYAKKNAVIGWNKGSLIFDVRSSAPELQKLTLKDIEDTLGKPNDTKVNGDDKIYIYKANDQFELKFIIPKSIGKVDHISVFSPQDSINSMAN